MSKPSDRFRKRRHARLLALLDALPHPLRILDVGGSVDYWRRYGVPDGAAITLFNRATRPPDDLPDRFHYVSGDACAMPQFADGEFDLAFSNSVIEHVGTFSRQQEMAAEIQRVGRTYWVQTPARSFPLEPHFRLPWFQFWPMRLRLIVVKLGIFTGAYPAWAARECRTIRLLTADELARLFPDGELWREQVGPLTKSFVALTTPR